VPAGFCQPSAIKKGRRPLPFTVGSAFQDLPGGPMRHFSVIIVFLIILGMANVALAEMYSWKDANGVRHYSNYPPPTGVTAASEQKEMVSTPAPVTKQPAAGTRPEQKFDADSRETRVIVLGNAVIVPVTFGYQGRQIEAKLLLDTGAAHTVYFETATSHKNIVEFKPIKGRVAGGGAITGQGIEVEYLRVGPKTQPDVKVFILKESGSTSGADGLLGMNFLKHHKHYVDLERKVIVWINK
jgi:hypothetical protein